MRKIPPQAQQFYTGFFDNNVACAIVLHRHETILHGALTTQALLLESLKSSDTMQAQSSTYAGVGAMKRVPIVSNNSFLSISEVLVALSHVSSGAKKTRQIFKGGDTDPKLFELFQSGVQYNRSYKTAAIDRHDKYTLYLRLMESISKGDKESLLTTLDSINDLNVPMDLLASGNQTYSLKNNAIKISAMCAYTAIQAGVPFSKVMDLLDDFIAETEKCVNITDIFELLKAVLFSFTRTVAVSRITAYSKPVRQAIEYIEAHYAEKITLVKLAAHVGLSESYLSSLLTKETGMTLADNINRARIEQSKKIMLHSNVTVSELSSMVGYTYSNHFAKRFRQFTGMMPTEYQKFLIDDEANAEGSADILRLIHGQLQHITSLFPGIFDVGRIVDPSTNTCWIQKQDGKIGVATCYDFWERKTACDTCISYLAFEKNRPFVKMDQGTGDPYITLAAPITVGNKRYVLEILKNISTDFFDCINKDNRFRQKVLE